MVGNKVAQKAIAAALTGMLAFGAAAPALAGVDEGNNWWRVNGDHSEKYSFTAITDGTPDVSTGASDSTVAGVNRYDTMWDAANYNAANGNWFVDADPNITNADSYVVLVSGTSYADALAASAVAGVYDAPILTTPADKLGLQAERAIKWFAQNATNTNADGSKKELTVLIVGGSAAVSDDVKAAVAGIEKGADGTTDVSVKTVRIYGENRMATSEAATRWVNQYVKKSANDPTNTIFVANGYAWADALSVSSYAYGGQAPLILTDAEGKLTENQISYLKTQLRNGVHVEVVGGPAKLAYEALVDLGVTDGEIEWLAGTNRYDTSRLVVEKNANNWLGWGIGLDAIAVATGENWPDALVGGAFVGAQNGTLVLIGEHGKTNNWAAAVEAAIRVNNNTPYGKKYILGGTAAVSDETATVLKATF